MSSKTIVDLIEELIVAKVKRHTTDWPDTMIACDERARQLKKEINSLLEGKQRRTI